MNPFAQTSNFRRFVASLLMALMTLGPAATPAYAALTLLADEPLNVRNAAKPNIVLTIDDSTSMLFDYLPDYVVNVWCRDNVGGMSSECGNGGGSTDLAALSRGRYQSPGYIYSQYRIPYPDLQSPQVYDYSGPGAGCDLANFATAKCYGGTDPSSGAPTTFTPGKLFPAITASPGIDTYPKTSTLPPPSSKRAGLPYEYNLFWPAPAHNAALNKLYYDPRLTYDPPVQSTSVSFPSMTGGNTSNWTHVPVDPWAATVVYVDLTAMVQVGQWCNSDWTQGNDPATSQPYANDLSHCRTNGDVAPAANAAPAGNGDYIYPWAPVGMSVTDMVSINKVSSIDPSIALSLANWKATIATKTVTAYGPPTARTRNISTKTTTCCGAIRRARNGRVGAPRVTQTCNGASSASPDLQRPSDTDLRAAVRRRRAMVFCPPIASVKLHRRVPGSRIRRHVPVRAPKCAIWPRKTALAYKPRIARLARKRATTYAPRRATVPAPRRAMAIGRKPAPTFSPFAPRRRRRAAPPRWSPAGCNLLPQTPENVCNLVTTCPPPTCVNQGNCSVNTGDFLHCRQCGDPMPGAQRFVQPHGRCLYAGIRLPDVGQLQCQHRHVLQRKRRLRNAAGNLQCQRDNVSQQWTMWASRSLQRADGHHLHEQRQLHIAHPGRVQQDQCGVHQQRGLPPGRKLLDIDRDRLHQQCTVRNAERYMLDDCGGVHHQRPVRQHR